MKPSTQERIDRMMAATNSPTFSEAMLRELFLSELTQQDRDTRHTCAEAVILAIPRGHILSPDAAHAACMNAQSI